MPRGRNPSSLPSKILEGLLQEVDDFLFLCFHPQAVLRTVGDVESARLMLERKEIKLKRLSQKKFKQALQRLEKQNFIELRTKGEDVVIALTARGVEEGLKRQILQKKKLLKPDRQCYVSFDIPETIKEVRFALRYLLKNAGFKMIQLSLWSTPRDVGKEMAAFIFLIGAKKWVHVFEAKQIVHRPFGKRHR